METTAVATLERGAEVPPDASADGDRVEAIRQLFDKIDEAEAVTDEYRWAAAELIAAEVEAGKTCKDLAEQLSTEQLTRSAMYVSRYNRAWKRFQEDPSVREGSFSRAYAPPPVTQVTEKTDKKADSAPAGGVRRVLEAFDGEGDSLDDLRALRDEAVAFVDRLDGWIEAAEQADTEAA